ncbi:hypothetical protein M413DRAFT_90130 [Hebeloma cylindrosporum]|uniref:JmjC domain-containing protein n=1 Tax=Hebeloma cylindrosporum TaxID=76867 RepID=A0A0C3CYJ6_HEBCY|nr:hypothetical protein M413DRAFT_90130 [Hebeloma cylindrosporum h7]
MTFESVRKGLMSKPRTWGDIVETLPYTLQGPNPSTPIPQVDIPADPNVPLHESGDNANMNDDRRGNHDQAREDRQPTPDAPPHSDVSCGLLDPLTMTSTRGWSLDLLLETGPNFHDVRRVSITSPDLRDTIRDVFEVKGRPLVIEGFHQHPQWPKEIFTLEHFGNSMEDNDINVRNVHNWTDSKIPLEEFITKCRTSGRYREDNEEVRFYGKDLECPETWENWLQTGGVVPPSLISKGPEDLFRYRPETTPVETLMCYLGIGDTFTPCHKDLCASSGQNLMCYTEDDGSSFWFMTESSIAPVAARYFQELGQELDHENHVITLEELMKAPFKVFVIEQRIGDLVLVPPRSCHQVVNFGGITIKSSWSRMSLKGLSTAYYHELPIYRRVCRPEIYRVKSTIHHTLVGRTKELQTSLLANKAFDNNMTDLVKDIKILLTLYDSILVEEYEPGHKDMISRPTSRPPSIEEDICICCDFCGCDIFQSFFECGPSSEGCVICPGCYVEGRNCKCRNARMQPMQYRDFQQLIDVRTDAVDSVARHEERFNRSFKLKLDLKLLDGKAAAVFRAACILYRNRLSIKPTKVCRQVKMLQTSHPVDFYSALTCKQCHNTKCFTHILVDLKVHSVEALLFHHIDATHEKYHFNHQRRLRGNSDPRNQLELQRHQKQGTPPDRFLQLFDAASSYGDCRPLKVDAMSLGWYDNHPQSATAVSNFLEWNHGFIEGTSTDPG